MKQKYAIDQTLTGVERTRARKLAYYYANKEKVKARVEANKDAISAQRKDYRQRNKDKLATANAEWREAHREYAKQKTAQWRAADPARAAQSRKDYYTAHREEILEKQRKWIAKNVEALREYHRKRYQQMPELYVSAYHRRRARKLQATAAWDTDLTELASVEAADLVRKRKEATGMKWHTDHVVPLRGKVVSGLHVWNNLQVIPAAANLSKSNAFRG